MKQLLIAGFFFVCIASARAAEHAYHAIFTGTVQAQGVNAFGDLRIETGRLNNARVFREFHVSEADYALVLTPDNDSVHLIPRRAVSNLPTIPVITSTGSYYLTSEKARAVKSFITLGSVDADLGNVFRELRGYATGTYRLDNEGSFGRTTLTLIGFGVTGINDHSGTILKARILSGKRFVPGS